jgi:hypothetical protein
MSAKHTKGPWVVRNGSNVFQGSHRVCSVNAAERLSIVDSQERAGANARLIAAAPELRDALILLVRTHDEPAETLLQEVKEQKWLEQARAAIAKATGGQQ